MLAPDERSLQVDLVRLDRAVPDTGCRRLRSGCSIVLSFCTAVPASAREFPTGTLLTRRHSWMSIQNQRGILGDGYRRDGERDGKSRLFDNGHAENASKPDS